MTSKDTFKFHCTHSLYRTAFQRRVFFAKVKQFETNVLKKYMHCTPRFPKNSKVYNFSLLFGFVHLLLVFYFTYKQILLGLTHLHKITSKKRITQSSNAKKPQH